MIQNLVWLIAVWGGVALAYRFAWLTWKAHRRIAVVAARTRLHTRLAADSMARTMENLVAMPYCPACGLPAALTAPGVWEHPYCPENLVTA